MISATGAEDSETVTTDDVTPPSSPEMGHDDVDGVGAKSQEGVVVVKGEGKCSQELVKPPNYCESSGGDNGDGDDVRTKGQGVVSVEGSEYKGEGVVEPPKLCETGHFLGTKSQGGVVGGVDGCSEDGVALTPKLCGVADDVGTRSQGVVGSESKCSQDGIAPPKLREVGDAVGTESKRVFECGTKCNDDNDNVRNFPPVDHGGVRPASETMLSCCLNEISNGDGGSGDDGDEIFCFLSNTGSERGTVDDNYTANDVDNIDDDYAEKSDRRVDHYNITVGGNYSEEFRRNGVTNGQRVDDEMVDILCNEIEGLTESDEGGVVDVALVPPEIAGTQSEGNMSGRAAAAQERLMLLGPTSAPDVEKSGVTANNQGRMEVEQNTQDQDVLVIAQVTRHAEVSRTGSGRVGSNDDGREEMITRRLSSGVGATVVEAKEAAAVNERSGSRNDGAKHMREKNDVAGSGPEAIKKGSAEATAAAAAPTSNSSAPGVDASSVRSEHGEREIEQMVEKLENSSTAIAGRSPSKEDRIPAEEGSEGCTNIAVFPENATEEAGMILESGGPQGVVDESEDGRVEVEDGAYGSSHTRKKSGILVGGPAGSPEVTRRAAPEAGAVARMEVERVAGTKTSPKGSSFWGREGKGLWGGKSVKMSQKKPSKLMSWGRDRKGNSRAS